MVSLLALLLAQSAAATPPPTEGAEVVVTARADPEREIRDFVDVLADTRVSGRIERFETRQACPAVTGLPPSFAQAVVARMRRIAAAAEVPLAKPGCRANVVAMVVTDKRAFLATLERKYPQFLSGLSGEARRKLMRDEGPAVAWQLSGAGLNADGVELEADPDSGATVNRTTTRGSRLTDSGRTQFTGAVVVIEAKALTGLTTTQVADYAAMRGFARTDPTKLVGSRVPTILKVLDAPMGSEVPLTLTDWDLGYLRGLYAAPMNVRAVQQRSAIRKGVERTLENDR